jgi:hypothetical protein
MKATELYNDVDFDYPTCGGYIITEGSKYLTIERQSNFAGNKTDGKCRFPKNSPTAIAIKKDIEEDTVDQAWLSDLDYHGGYTVE